MSPDSLLKQTSITSFYNLSAKKLKRDDGLSTIARVTPSQNVANDTAIINAQLLSEMEINGRRLVPLMKNLTEADIVAYCSAGATSSIITNLTYLHELAKNRKIRRPAVGQTATIPVAADTQCVAYSVEHILEVNEIDGEPHFHVKWRGWATADNTWEPLENVRHCDRFVTFIANEIKLLQNEIEEIAVSVAFALPDETSTDNSVDDTSESGNATDVAAFERLRAFDELQFQSNLLMVARMRRDNDAHNDAQYSRMYAKLQRDLQLLPIHMRRMRQLDQLQAFEQHINATDKSSNLTVENLVDFDGPPAQFEYINDVFAGEGVTIPDDPRIGCSCGVGGCNFRSQCCAKEANSTFAYNKKRRIRVPLGVPVFECNRYCACDATCMNRVVQQGRKHSLCIFKTGNGCGWSVRTLRTIWKGQFICEYVGEVVTHEEAERRGHDYDAQGITYLFDLDMNRKDNLYTVDAAYYGNVSHFINHSCDSNCGVWAVYINCVDLDLPRLCLFATRKIEAGEELSFDYESNLVERVIASEDSVVPLDRMKKQMHCRCGSVKCRKIIF